MPATPVHHTATSDATWDAGKARKSYPNQEATLKAVHAWFSADGDPNAKASYKFPHHYTKGGPAVLAAVRNGLARLPNAQVDDKPNVEKHLQAHLDDGNSSDHFHLADGSAVANESWKAVYADWRNKVNNRTGLPTGDIQIWNASKPNEMMIYDEIGYWGVTAKRFIDQMKDVKGDFTLRLNSPGGDMFDGLAIYNAILAHDGFVTVQIDGLAASAASFIAMAGDHIVIADAAMMMIHDAMGFAMGNAADMQKMCDMLDKSSQKLAGIYAKRAGNTADYWRNLMREETWYAGMEAVDNNLADDLFEPITAIVTDTPIAKSEPPGAVLAPDNIGSLFKYAMADAVREPDAPEPKPFSWDSDVFKAAVSEAHNNAPAVPVLPRTTGAPKPPPVKSIRLADLADALKEGLR